MSYKPDQSTYDSLGHMDVVAHGHAEGGHVYFKKTFSASEDVIIIDLSDTTNYPHENTTSIHTANMILGIQGDASADFLIQIGFLDTVDGTDSNFHGIFDVDGSKKAGQSFAFSIVQQPEAPHLLTSKFLGPQQSNLTEFNTGTNLRSTLDPDGAVATPSGQGDLAMRVTRTAGTFAVSLMIGYHTH